MPFVTYRLRLEGEEFEEKDIFEHTDRPRDEIEQIVYCLNQTRRKLKEPLIEIVSVKVTNQFYHLHSWSRTHEVKWVEKTYYQCKYCKITGHRKIGHPNASVTRDEQFKADKHQLCKDQLRELPPINW